MSPRPPLERLALPLLALSLLALVTTCGGSEDERPNVVLVTLDTTRPDYFSCYGYTSGHTPSFDALAAAGVRFENALSASAVTPVSHATILTGKYPYHHGLRVLSADGGFRLPAGEPTLAGKLRKQGYRTIAVHSAFPVSRHFGFDRDFDVFESVEGKMQNDRWELRELQRRSDQTTDLALAAVNKGKGPFFLWVHYWDPHDPIWIPPREYLQDVKLDVSGNIIPGDRNLDRVYAAEVRFLDEQFGRLIQGLDSRGELTSSLVVVTSDHGEGLSDGEERHGWRAHRLVYQEQIHVPLLLRGPGIPAARVVPDFVRTVDIVPTIEDYLGLPIDANLDGATLRDLIEGRPSTPRIAYADQINGYDKNSGLGDRKPDAAFLYSVVDADGFKLIYRPHMPEASELFDLKSDPKELTNLAASRPDKYQHLLLDLAHRRPWVLAPFAPDPQGTADVSNALGGLGYTGSEIVGEEWTWTCPLHPDLHQLDITPPRHDACGSPLVPVAKH